MEERLQKIIARAGIASRRHAEQMITSGLVTVNGTTITELGSKADESRDHIKVNGKLLQPAQERLYLLLHKPTEVVSTMSDPEGRRSLSDLLYGVSERVFPVGRLEYHSAGLVFLTNDGDLANQLLRSHHVRQTYHIKVKALLTFAEIESLGRSTGAHIERLKGKESPWYIVTLSEARSDALRDKLFQSGHPVEKIRRVGIANLELGGLASGSHRPLTPVELAAFKRAITTGENSGEGDAKGSAQHNGKHSPRPASFTAPRGAGARNAWRASKNNQHRNSPRAGARIGQEKPQGAAFQAPGRAPGRTDERGSSRPSQHKPWTKAPNNRHDHSHSASHSAPSQSSADGASSEAPRNPFFRPGQNGPERSAHSASNRPDRSDRPNRPDRSNRSDRPDRNSPRGGDRGTKRPSYGGSQAGPHIPPSVPRRNGPAGPGYNSPRIERTNVPSTGDAHQGPPRGGSPRSGQQGSYGASNRPTGRPAGRPTGRPTNRPGGRPPSRSFGSAPTSAPPRTGPPSARYNSPRDPSGNAPKNFSRTGPSNSQAPPYRPADRTSSAPSSSHSRGPQGHDSRPPADRNSHGKPSRPWRDKPGRKNKP